MLEEAIDKLGIGEETDALTAAAAFSDGVVTDSRAFLQNRIDADLPVDVLVLGSIARGEATAASDLDYLVVTHGLLDDPASGVRTIIDAMELLRGELLDLREPGRTGIFGRLVAAQDLVEHIGLQDDSNDNHTRRILLLTESRSLFDEGRHERLLRAIVRRYLADYAEPSSSTHHPCRQGPAPT